MIDWNGIEEKWRKKWQESKDFETNPNSKEKKFITVAYPYPNSPQHIGHGRTYTLADVHARFLRMKGYNVFEPIGFDSFGLPAENYAIKTGVHPVKSIAQNCAVMEKQLSVIGTMYEWEKKIVTSDPEYYKWTQWVFLQW